MHLTRLERRPQVGWGALVCVAWTALLPACAPAPEPSACDPLAARAVWISREEYLPCAGDILVTLDRLESHLDRVLAGNTGARSDFSQTHRRLEALMKKAGFPTYREFREHVAGGGSAKYVNGMNQRVVDSDPTIGMLNGQIWAAYVALTREDQTLSTLNEGRQAHARAKGFYQHLR